MLNQLLKFTLVSSLLLWLKPRWKGLLALCVAVILVHIVHGEYLGYVELSGDRSLLVWSYVFKWIALLAAVLVYLFFVLFGSRRSSPRSAKGAGSGAPDPLANGPADDGFDFLRHKKELKSRADVVISEEVGRKGR
jgi:hypothetical protein